MKKTVAWIALAIALPTAALAEEHARILADEEAMMHDGRAEQAMEEARANVEAFKRLQEQERALREAASGGSYASGRGVAAKRH
jgi:hypothetical protein